MRGVRSRGMFDPSDLAGDGRGVVGQIRVLGVMLLIAGGASLLIGGYWWLGSISTVWTAAAIEDGRLPSNFQFRRRARVLATEVVGHVVQADAVIVQGPRVWVYAPLVSDRPGADDHPRIYFGASAQAFDRAVTEKRFRGVLLGRVPFNVRQAFQAHGRTVADDAYFLESDGFVEGNAAAGRAVMIWGALLAVLGLVAFNFATRRQEGRRPVPRE